MDTPDLDRLTLLERAQLLHDATLRRHGEMLDRHADHMAHLEILMEQQLQNQTALREIADRLAQQQAEQATRLDRHDETMVSLAQTLAAIKDLLPRGNGH
jgi:hypothetical protein